MIQLVVRGVGRSLEVTLPGELVRAMGLRAGDRLLLTAVPGGFRLTSGDPCFAESWRIAEDFLRRYRNALRALAG